MRDGAHQPLPETVQIFDHTRQTATARADLVEDTGGKCVGGKERMDEVWKEQLKVGGRESGRGGGGESECVT